PAYPDRIVFSFPIPHEFHGGPDAERELNAAEDAVEAGRLDLLADVAPTQHEIDAYRADSKLAQRLKESPTNGLFWVDFRLTIPPFDDLHVRKAVSYVIDRATLYRLEFAPGPSSGMPAVPATVANHLAPDTLER